MDGESVEERVIRAIETAVELSDAALAAFVAEETRETYDVTEVFESSSSTSAASAEGFNRSRVRLKVPPLSPDAGH
jgi:hypothetical protein